MLQAVEDSGNFVDLEVSAKAWIILAVILAVLLAIDLIRHRDDHVAPTKEIVVETIGWVSCGLAFGVGVWLAYGSEAFGEYMSGYLIEESLSIDNVFVWAIVFSSMKVPVKFQHRVLFWGVFGALVLRFAFILVGTVLIARFWWLLVVFGVFLIVTGIKIIRHTDGDENESSTAGLGLLKRIMPVSNELDGHNFITMVDGVRTATPLLAALVVLEATDVIFAVDSVPAVLAVSNEPYIVFSSNAFALLGLRSMYFLLANAKERFHYLSHGLGAILVFVGVKMAIGHWYHIDTYISLAVIVVILLLAMVYSEKKRPEVTA